MTVRQQAADRNGRTLAPGMKVRVIGEGGQPEGTVVRVLGDYDQATVLIEQKNQKAERLYPGRDLEVL